MLKGNFVRFVLLEQATAAAVSFASHSFNIWIFLHVSTRQCHGSPVALLSVETPDFIGPQYWPPNSPDSNPVDYTRSGIFARTGVQLPDPGRRPFERTTDSCMAPL